jgi:hypothetical protein
MIVRLVVLFVLAALVLLTVADRLTESAAAHAVSVKARQSGQLAADPTVTIKGFPFLTQAFRGRYDEIDVTTHGIHRSGLRLETVSGRFLGVHVGLGATLDGAVASARIDQASGEVDVSYADLDAFLASRHVTIAEVGTTTTAARFTGRTVVGRVIVPIGGPVTVSARAGVLSLTPSAAGLRATGATLTAKQAAALAAAFTLRIPLAHLPFGVFVGTAAAGPGGLRLTGPAVGLAVAVPSDAAQTGTP